MKYTFLSAIIMISSSFLAFNALADIKPGEKDYAKSLKELCYTKFSKEFNNFAAIANINIRGYTEKIKKLNGNYYKFIPVYDILVTSDALKRSIIDINRSLNRLNKVRSACANELDDYREKG